MFAYFLKLIDRLSRRSKILRPFTQTPRNSCRPLAIPIALPVCTVEHRNLQKILKQGGSRADSGLRDDLGDLIRPSLGRSRRYMTITTIGVSLDRHTGRNHVAVGMDRRRYLGSNAIGTLLLQSLLAVCKRLLELAVADFISFGSCIQCGLLGLVGGFLRGILSGLDSGEVVVLGLGADALGAWVIGELLNTKVRDEASQEETGSQGRSDEENWEKEEGQKPHSGG